MTGLVNRAGISKPVAVLVQTYRQTYVYALINNSRVILIIEIEKINELDDGQLANFSYLLQFDFR